MTQSTEPCYIAFMAALEHQHMPSVLDFLQEYSTVSEYLISKETSPNSHKETGGQHLHFLVHMSPKDYKNFSERIFRKKYNLRGQAKKGLPRQYGRLKEIHDLEAMGAYTVKDGNITTNMDDAVISKWSEASYKRDEERTFREKVFEFIDNMEPPGLGYDYANGEETLPLSFGPPDEAFKKPANWVQLQILEYFRKHTQKTPTRNTIINMTTQYMLHHTKDADYLLRYTIEEVALYLKLDICV